MVEVCCRSAAPRNERVYCVFGGDMRKKEKGLGFGYIPENCKNGPSSSPIYFQGSKIRLTV